MARHAVLEGAPLLIAHRGGSGLAPENTLEAFRNGVDVWGADMVELDVHASLDGHCVVIHDPTVNRTTDGSGAVARMTLAELRELDAGYRFIAEPTGFGSGSGSGSGVATAAAAAPATPTAPPSASASGDVDYPFRGRGVGIPTIEEVLESFPGLRLTVELKTGAAQAPLLAAIRRFNASDRIIIAGMHAKHRALFSDYAGAVSAAGEQLRWFYIRHRLGLGKRWPPRADVVQMPERWAGRRVLTPRLIAELLANDIPVHVWTVDAAADMHRILDWGVEGIITDRPDVLGRVLHERVGRPLTAAHRRADGP
jgi:glycerophosphoryl diester phosphodiesterase